MHKNIIVRAKDPSDVEDIMSQYDENLEIDDYVCKTKEEIIDDMKAYVAETLKKYPDYPNGDPLEDNNEEQARKYHYGRLDAYGGADMLLKTDDEIYQIYRKECCDECDKFDDDGNLLSNYNPNGEWDWWTVGGRWEGKFTLKDGTIADVAKMADIDWEATCRPTEDQRNYAKRCWDTVVNGKSYPNTDNEAVFYPNKKYLLDRYKDEDDYLRHISKFTSQSFVDEDGWHEDREYMDKSLQYGNAGYDAAQSAAEKQWDEEYMDRFIYSTDPEDYLVSIDVHY